MTLSKGKLSLTELERLVFPYLPRVEDNRQVLLDYGSVQIDGTMVVASDPVLGIPLQFYGFFAVHYSATDVAMALATPKYLSLGVYYPPGTKEDWLKATMKQLGEEAQLLDLQIIGGHTGGYDGLKTPLIATTCFGLLSEAPESPPMIQIGDVIISVGPVGRETLWFLANVEPTNVDAILSRSQREEIANNLKPFSVVPLVNALPREKITLLHDLAEGGLGSALFELQKATGLGISVKYNEIPWDEQGIQLFNFLEWNPLYCSSFGSFLIVTKHESSSAVLQALKRFDRKAAVIGTFTKKKHVLIESGEESKRLELGEDPYKRFTAHIT